MEAASVVKRGTTGTYTTTTVGGERVEAFVPLGLPPRPPLVMDGRLQMLVESATLGVGRLDGVSTLLPDKALFLDAFVRKEALVSSQIEGTQSSLSDLLLFETDGVPGVPLDDVREVSSYVAALDHGVSRLREGFPLSGRLLREVHGVLLRSGRGRDRDPGAFRRSQNWDRREPAGTRASRRRIRRLRLRWPISRRSSTPATAASPSSARARRWRPIGESRLVLDRPFVSQTPMPDHHQGLEELMPQEATT